MAAEEGATIVRLGHVLYDSRRARGSRRSRSTAGLPAMRAATRPCPRRRARARGQPSAYSSATPSGWQRVGLVLGAHHEHGHVELRERSRPFHAIERGTSRSAWATAARCSWRSMRCLRRLARDLAPALRQARGLRDLDERVDAASSSASASCVPELAVGIAGARIARVGRRDLHQRRHPLRMLEGERHRRRGAHRAADQRGALELELRRARRRGPRPGPRTRSSARGTERAVAARVVGDQAVAALDAARASPARTLRRVADSPCSSTTGGPSPSASPSSVMLPAPGSWRKTWNSVACHGLRLRPPAADPGRPALSVRRPSSNCEHERRRRWSIVDPASAGRWVRTCASARHRPSPTVA